MSEPTPVSKPDREAGHTREPWEAREAAIADRVAVSRKRLLFKHLSDAPWYVETLRGQIVTSLRDAATAVIETVGTDDVARVCWLDAESSACNCGRVTLRGRVRGKPNLKMAAMSGIVLRNDVEWVLADQAAVCAAFPDALPLVTAGRDQSLPCGEVCDMDAAIEYAVQEVLARPIPAVCPRCKRAFTGRDAILAPSLDNVNCFYCGPNRQSRLVIHPDHKGFVTAKAARAVALANAFAIDLFTPPEVRYV